MGILLLIKINYICIAKMHTTVQKVSKVWSAKKMNYISDMSSCKTPKVKAELQSVDYAATYIRKKYLSLCPSEYLET
jgi:hypothetical protein